MKAKEDIASWFLQVARMSIWCTVASRCFSQLVARIAEIFIPRRGQSISNLRSRNQLQSWCNIPRRLSLDLAGCWQSGTDSNIISNWRCFCPFYLCFCRARSTNIQTSWNSIWESAEGREEKCCYFCAALVLGFPTFLWADSTPARRFRNNRLLVPAAW